MRKRAIEIVDDIIMFITLLSMPLTSISIITSMVRLFYYQDDGDWTRLLMNLACLFGIISLACWCYMMARGFVHDIVVAIKNKKHNSQ